MKTFKPYTQTRRHAVLVNKENLWGVYKDEKINVPFYQPLLNKIWNVNWPPAKQYYPNKCI